MKRVETILEEAGRIVHGDRNKDYGHPLDDFSRTAAMATGMLSAKLKPACKITAEEVGLFMILVKVSRQVNRPKRDNMTDAAGYAATVQMCIEEAKNRSRRINNAWCKQLDQVREFNRLKKADREKKKRRKDGKFAKKKG